MTWFRDLRIGTKMFLGFAFILSLMALVGAYSIAALTQLGDVSTDIETRAMPAARYAANMNTNTAEFRVAQLQHAWAVDPEAIRHYESVMETQLARLAKNEEAYLSTNPRDEERRHHEAFRRGWDRFMSGQDAFLAASRALRTDEVRAILLVGDKRFEEANNELLIMTDLAVKDGAAATATGTRTIASARRTIVSLFVFALLVSLAAALLLGRSVARSAAGLTDVARLVARGNVEQAVTIRSNDEIGIVAESFRDVQATLARLLKDTRSIITRAKSGELDVAGDADAYEGAFARLMTDLNELLSVLGAPIHTILPLVPVMAGSAHELTSVSLEMSASAEQTSSQAVAVAAAADQVSRSVQTMSTASEQMDASIREIARSATQAASVATAGLKSAEGANATIASLGKSSSEIGDVIRVITSIAQQTNLLALNATIEAARAGDAGKGFAVVASEVKELAKQTARATEDIGKRVESIRSDATGAVAALDEVGRVIREIHSLQTSVAVAVEEQTATTNEMARNLLDAERGSSEIARSIRGVADSGKSTARAADDVQKTAKELARMSEEILAVVRRFKTGAARPARVS
jgi:methyl-accepting chemotaxis protein